MKALVVRNQRLEKVVPTNNLSLFPVVVLKYIKSAMLLMDKALGST